MKKNLLHILLILVALQSTIAVADLHQSHQTENEHLDIGHVDIVESELEVSSYIVDITQTTISFDCQHCCHCHGVTCHFLDNIEINQVPFMNISIHFRHSFQFNSRPIPPALRPPIA